MLTMVRLLRHRQTKGAVTDMLGLRNAVACSLLYPMFFVTPMFFAMFLTPMFLFDPNVFSNCAKICNLRTKYKFLAVFSNASSFFP